MFDRQVAAKVLALAALQGSIETRYATRTFVARRLSNVGHHPCNIPATMTKISRKLLSFCLHLGAQFSFSLGTRFSQLHLGAQFQANKKQVLLVGRSLRLPGIPLATLSVVETTHSRQTSSNDYFFLTIQQTPQEQTFLITRITTLFRFSLRFPRSSWQTNYFMFFSTDPSDSGLKWTEQIARVTQENNYNQLYTKSVILLMSQSSKGVRTYVVKF